MLRLLLVSPTLNGITGADRDWLNLANALDPACFSLIWAGQRGSGELRSLLDPELPVEFLDLEFPRFTYLIQDEAYLQRSPFLWSKILVDHALRLARPLARLRQSLRGRRIDLVISNTAAVTFGPLCATVLRRPHVWFVKECLDPAIAECRSMARLIGRLSDAVVVPSRAAALPFARPVHILPDGSPAQAILRQAARVNVSEVRQRLSLPVDEPVVAQVGGGSGWKGQHVLAQALVKLAQKREGPLCSVLFLGNLSGSYRQRLDQTLGQLGPAWRSRIRFASFAPDDYSLIETADIVAHPSVLPDPFPNAVREAMILGKPVIGSTAGGIPEMIEDGRTGLLVPPNDPDSLADALSSLLADVNLRRRLGDAAREHALLAFDVEKCKQPVIDLFYRLTGTRNGSGIQ
jgi:glycosyltransferase involved in cell wall biosynthesis